MNFFALFIFNVFLNSFLMFFTAVFLIEGIIFLCRVRLGRVTSFLRMTPILKLPIDLFFYNFSRWSYVHGIDPVECVKGSRTLSTTIGSIYSTIQFTTAEEKTFTVADVLSHFIPSVFLTLFMFLLLGISLFCLLRKGGIYYRLMSSLKNLAPSKVETTIANRKIKNKLKKFQLSVTCSPSLKGSPFIAGLKSKAIYLPSGLLTTLTNKEYEAVLAHEIAHIRNKDLYTRLILDLIEALFWWVPTKWLRKRIEEGQEIACDAQCKKYAVRPLDLASALHKSAAFSLACPKPIVGGRFTKDHVQKRIKIVLRMQPERFRKLQYTVSALALMLAFFIVFSGRFWIF